LVANPGPSWHIDRTDDFNGDGKADIVLPKDSGAVAAGI
jgi:FG-GAP repeat